MIFKISKSSLSVWNKIWFCNSAMLRFGFVTALCMCDTEKILARKFSSCGYIEKCIITTFPWGSYRSESSSHYGRKENMLVIGGLNQKQNHNAALNQ